MPLRLPDSLHDTIAGAIAIASHPEQKRPKLTPGDHPALIILEKALRNRGQVAHNAFGPATYVPDAHVFSVSGGTVL